MTIKTLVETALVLYIKIHVKDSLKLISLHWQDMSLCLALPTS
jgi:hypothetical protein